jgi:hypothetical protein
VLPANDIGLCGTSYDNTGELSATTWRHVHFIEHIAKNGERATEMPPFQSNWLVMSDVCKHCSPAPCLEACPTARLRLWCTHTRCGSADAVSRWAPCRTRMCPAVPVVIPLAVLVSRFLLRHVLLRAGKYFGETPHGLFSDRGKAATMGTDRC